MNGRVFPLRVLSRPFLGFRSGKRSYENSALLIDALDVPYSWIGLRFYNLVLHDKPSRFERCTKAQHRRDVRCINYEGRKLRKDYRDGRKPKQRES